MQQAMSMEGKSALVTGGGSGIGAAIALRLAGAGVRVGVIDRHGDAAAEVCAQIAAEGGEALPLTADVSDRASIEDAIAAVVAQWSRLDIAVNNAGIGGGRTSFEATSDEAFDQCIAVNLRGVFLSMRREIQIMRAQGGGAIVNIASALSLIGHGTSADYVAAKHGVLGLTRSAAIEYGPLAIRVNALCPGIIETPLFRQSFGSAEERAQTEALHPMARLGTPEEVAEATLWLASPASSFVTGAAITVDGGWTAR